MALCQSRFSSGRRPPLIMIQQSCRWLALARGGSVHLPCPLRRVSFFFFVARRCLAMVLSIDARWVLVECTRRNTRHDASA